MNPLQIELVQSSFKLVTPIISASSNSALPCVRCSEDLAKRGSKTRACVNRGGVAGTLITEFGQSIYGTVGAALPWTLETGLAEAFTAGVREAWTTAYRFLSTTMQEAAANAETAEWLPVQQHT